MRALVATALLLSLSACATTPSPRPVPETHTLVPGSRVALAIPAGFRHDAELPGFGSPDGSAAIFVNELPGSVYSTMRSFSGESFQENGMLLDDQENVRVDGWPARLYHASQPVRDTELARLVLVFGDASRSVVLTAVAPRSQWPERSEALRASLLSARWHKARAPGRRDDPPEVESP